jgi:glycosyltransferase involved in cell wall biosynthesis
MRRIGIYVPHGDVPDVRGFSPAIVAWQHALRLRRFEPLLFCANETGRAAKEAHFGIPIHRMRVSRLYRRVFCKWTRWDPLPLHRRVSSPVRRAAIALWHAHQLEFPVADFKRALRKPLPVIVHAHVTAQRYHAERGLAERYLAVSDYVRRTLAEEKGYPPERIAVLPNGVDTNLFRPGDEAERAAIRATLGLPLDAPLVLFAGRKQEVKGFDTFLAAAREILKQPGDAVFLAVGPEPPDARRESSFAQCQALRSELARSPRYRELDALPQDRLAALFRAADILLAPSRTETQGMVMIEGMAAGLIVISSATGGILESIRHGETGLLLDDARDIHAAAKLLDKVLERPGDWVKMATEARLDAQRRFSWEAVVEKLENIYEEVITEWT